MSGDGWAYGAGLVMAFVAGLYGWHPMLCTLVFCVVTTATVALTEGTGRDDV